MKPSVKPDGKEYYEYVLVYTNDILCISHDARGTMELIARDFKFKKDEIKPPEIYLGARLEKKKLNDIDIWTMCIIDYL